MFSPYENTQVRRSWSVGAVLAYVYVEGSEP